jgi:hypothetical protein
MLVSGLESRFVHEIRTLWEARTQRLVWIQRLRQKNGDGISDDFMGLPFFPLIFLSSHFSVINILRADSLVGHHHPGPSGNLGLDWSTAV